MTLVLLWKLLAIVGIAGLGWVVGRLRWLGDAESEPARVLANAAFFIFAPALLFRTTARMPLENLPWHMLSAFFVPAIGGVMLLYGWGRWQRRRHPQLGAAAPAVRAITGTFGNSVQIGIPVAAALFGENGLALHLTLVSLHAVVLLTLLTALVEMDLAREEASAHLGSLLASTVKNTVIHPVVLPVLIGLGWNLLGLGVPDPLDELLRTLGAAVVPLCLTLIGMSLAYLGWPKAWQGALGLCLFKLLVLPALVLLVAHWAFGLTGLSLAVVVVMACLPAGSNALMFSQRYRTLEAETTAVTVLSTLALVLSLPLWLSLLEWLGGWGSA